MGALKRVAGGRREADHRAELVRHDRVRLADGGRLETERKLEPAQLPVVVGGDENVLRVDIAMDELADCVQKIERLENLLGRQAVGWRLGGGLVWFGLVSIIIDTWRESVGARLEPAPARWARAAAHLFSVLLFRSGPSCGRLIELAAGAVAAAQ